MGDSEPQSFEREVASFFNEYPLLWVVYAVLMLLPIVFLIACIWPKKKADSVAQRKKTDALTPDDRVSSGDAKRERGVPPARETREEREERPAVVETTRTEEENLKEEEEEEASLTSEPQPNRTGICPAGAATAAVEREIEVEHEQEQVEERGGGQEGGRLGTAESAPISNGAAVLRNGDVTKSSVSDSKPIMTAKEETSPALHNGDIVENGYHDDDDSPVVENGIDHNMTVETAEEEGVRSKRWSFPPILDDFNLMESDVDPTDLEAIFADDRLTEIDLQIQPDSPGLGISIVGGSGSPNGDLPIIIKRVLPKSLAEEDGRLKQGDELIAVNDTLLVGMSKDFAINALSSMHGDARLLVLQEY